VAAGAAERVYPAGQVGQYATPREDVHPQASVAPRAVVPVPPSRSYTSRCGRPTTVRPGAGRSRSRLPEPRRLVPASSPASRHNARSRGHAAQRAPGPAPTRTSTAPQLGYVPAPAVPRPHPSAQYDRSGQPQRRPTIGVCRSPDTNFQHTCYIRVVGVRTKLNTPATAFEHLPAACLAPSPSARCRRRWWS
jgi:hypothetical protein